MLLLAITYFTSIRWRPLVWVGGLALLPCALLLIFVPGIARQEDIGTSVAGYAGAYAIPLAVALFARGKQAWMNVVAAVWVLVLGMIARGLHLDRNADSPLLYLWCGLGAAGLVAWGMHERRSERVNFGMAAFAHYDSVLLFFFGDG